MIEITMQNYLKQLSLTTLLVIGLMACGDKKLQNENEALRKEVSYLEKINATLESENAERDSLLKDSGASFDSLNKTRQELDSLIRAGKGEKLILLKIEQVDSILQSTYKKIDFLEAKLKFEKGNNKNVNGWLAAVTNFRAQLREKEKENNVLRAEVKSLKGDISGLRTRMQRKDQRIASLNRDIRTETRKAGKAKVEARLSEQKRVEVIRNQVHSYVREGDIFKTQGNRVRQVLGKQKRKLYLNAYRVYYKALKIRKHNPDLAIAINYTVADIEAKINYLTRKLGTKKWVKDAIAKIHAGN